jgi:hypothetical protein
MRGAILPNDFSRLPPKVFCRFDHIIRVAPVIPKPLNPLEGQSLSYQ